MGEKRSCRSPTTMTSRASWSALCFVLAGGWITAAGKIQETNGVCVARPTLATAQPTDVPCARGRWPEGLGPTLARSSTRRGSGGAATRAWPRRAARLRKRSEGRTPRDPRRGRIGRFPDAHRVEATVPVRVSIGASHADLRRRRARRPGARRRAGCRGRARCALDAVARATGGRPRGRRVRRRAREPGRDARRRSPIRCGRRRPFAAPRTCAARRSTARASARRLAGR